MKIQTTMEKLKNSFSESTNFQSSIDSKLNKVSEGESNAEIRKVFVTPAMAMELLKSNSKNRRVKDAVVIRYANDMKQGRWKNDTFELILISANGFILNGQHRLWAVVKSGKTIPFHIAYNVQDEVFDVLDSGSARSSSDIFRVAGIKNDNTLPSIIQQYYVLATGKSKSSSTQKYHRLTSSQLLEEYYSNELFWQHTAKKAHVWYISFAKILTPSIIGGYYAHFFTISEKNANEFMDQLCTGMEIQNDIIALLRTKLMKDKMALRKMTAHEKFGLIIKAWNFFRTNKSVKLLKFDTDKEAFPAAV